MVTTIQTQATIPSSRSNTIQTVSNNKHLFHYGLTNKEITSASEYTQIDCILDFQTSQAVTKPSYMASSAVRGLIQSPTKWIL